MQKARILVVDDARLVRMFVRQAFTGFPEVVIHEAESGGKAQALLLESEFDLILCDWDMPQISGHELLAWIRSHKRPHISSLPFVMVTGSGEKERVLQAARTGVNGYIVKPFSAQHLIRQVQNALGKRSAAGGMESAAPTAGLRVDERNLRFDLGTVSHAGVAGRIDRISPYPAILAPVTVELALAPRRPAAIAGYIARLEAAEDTPNAGHLHVAIRFSGTTAVERELLDEFATALQRPQ